MTREEAIKCLEICKKYIDKIRASEGVEVSKELCMALDMAIKALEQEPCDDAISRSDMLDAIGHGTTYTSEDLQRIIKGLPSVTPKREQGEWKMIYRHHNEVKKYTGIDLMGDKHTIYVKEEYEGKEPYCPKCGKRADDLGQSFCGYCGAEMR